MELEIERFARSIGYDGVLISTFLPDIEDCRMEILAKPWSHQQRKKLEDRV